MPELIDAGLLIERIRAIRDLYGMTTEKDRAARGGVVACICAVHDAPKVDAQPVLHGRWIECDYEYIDHGEIKTEPRGGLCCSVCHVGFSKKKMTYKQYCAHCGARMDGGEQE